MVKKIFESGWLYIFVAILFVTGAVGKTIRENPAVSTMQWGCVLLFALLGIWRLSKFIKPKTRFKSLDEFYPAVDVLIARLTSEGHPTDAQKLDDIFHGTVCTTSSELLGELMLVLKNMRGKYSHELGHEISECREFAIHHRRILGL
jgi:hypothetical protein